MTRRDVRVAAGLADRAPGESPLADYQDCLEATAGWLDESIRRGNGGSCAFFSPAAGWSSPYPETTGYLIPTLLEVSSAVPGFDGEERALALGSWLISLQSPEGAWAAGVHPPKSKSKPSVFNSAQILQGMVALHDLDGEDRWLEAAQRACSWMARSVDGSGLWSNRDYRALGVPSYYTYAAWPMLQVALRCDDPPARDIAEGVLQIMLERRRPNGSFSDWGFSEGGKAAYSHTIAYTLQGLIESAKCLDDWPTYGQPTEQGLLALTELTEQADGRLAGRLDDEWKPAAGYVCLTGNSQIALCLLDLNEERPDPRLPAAARQLTDAVCATQRLNARLPGQRGAVGGSSPLWGRYMMLRYPNWAAKYHCDALLRLLGRET